MGRPPRRGLNVHHTRDNTKNGIVFESDPHRIAAALVLLTLPFVSHPAWAQDTSKSDPASTCPQTSPHPIAATTDQAAVCIRYIEPEAGTVWLLWGLDGWSIPEHRLRPASSIVVDNVLRTRLTRSGDSFEVSLIVPTGSTLDFGFLVTNKENGSSIVVWEADEEGDYHVPVNGDREIRIEGSAAIAALRPVVLDFASGPLMLAMTLLLAGLAVWQRRSRPDQPLVSRNPIYFVVVVSVVLSVFLVILRAHAAGLPWTTASEFIRSCSGALQTSYYDLLVAWIGAAGFALVLYLTRKFRKTHRIVRYAFLVLCVATIAISFFHIQILLVLGRPITYQWLYYSDFLGSLEARTAIVAGASGAVLLNLICLLSAFVLAVWAITVGFRFHRTRATTAITVSLCLVLIYLAVTPYVLAHSDWLPAQLENPELSLFGSWLGRHANPPLSSIEIPPDFIGFPEDVLTTDDEVPQGFLGDSSNTPIRNIVLFVLESVPAQMVSVFGSAFQVTPELAHAAEGARLYRNAYAQSPASNKSMFSILSGLYPWISFAAITEEVPSIRIKTLSSELKSRGFRTAFIATGDLSFQRGDEFLAHRSFDHIADVDNLTCQRGRYESTQWTFLRGTDERCLVDDFAGWHGEEPESPFFAMFWTAGTHYPYFPTQPEIAYSNGNPSLNRYLNSLREADEAFGNLMTYLTDRQLDKSTLVVVVGDHGEAFGSHQQVAHASGIFEENVNVPLMLINPVLFHGETSNTIAGHIDLAPTILDVLGLEAPTSWEGRSLFGPRSRRAYFFASWSDYLFGFREANAKYIFNASQSTLTAYDLGSDPNELRPQQLSDSTETEVLLSLAAWMRNHNTVIENLITESRTELRQANR